MNKKGATDWKMFSKFFFFFFSYHTFFFSFFYSSDPHYKDHQFCLSQENRVKNDPRGCLILNHDDPVTERVYYTLYDVLEYIGNNTQSYKVPIFFFFFFLFLFLTFIFYFFISKREKKIRIALCFKYESIYGDNCNATVGSYGYNWRSLIDDFYSLASNIITKYNLNLEFVLDGSGIPQNCLVDKWQPWVATW